MFRLILVLEYKNVEFYKYLILQYCKQYFKQYCKQYCKQYFKQYCKQYCKELRSHSQELTHDVLNLYNFTFEYFNRLA
jgi:hypothetical protein